MLLHHSTAASAGWGGRYSAQEPLLALRRTMVAALDCRGALPGVLEDVAKAARKAGQLHHGLVAVQHLDAAARAAPSGAAGRVLNLSRSWLN